MPDHRQSSELQCWTRKRRNGSTYVICRDGTSGANRRRDFEETLDRSRKNPRFFYDAIDPKGGQRVVIRNGKIVAREYTDIGPDGEKITGMYDSENEEWTPAAEYGNTTPSAYQTRRSVEREFPTIFVDRWAAVTGDVAAAYSTGVAIMALPIIVPALAVNAGSAPGYGAMVIGAATDAYAAAKTDDITNMIPTGLGVLSLSPKIRFIKNTLGGAGSEALGAGFTAAGTGATFTLNDPTQAAKPSAKSTASKEAVP
ncbi:MAG: hypothetical protein HQL50_14815 [Magnetococcales bacterium]|nr:hypothetical protein [Magnetococcales bacterium]